MAKHDGAFGGGYFFPYERKMGFTKDGTVSRYLNYGAPDDVQVRQSNPPPREPMDKLDRKLAEMRYNATQRAKNKTK